MVNASVGHSILNIELENELPVGDSLMDISCDTGIVAGPLSSETGSDCKDIEVSLDQIGDGDLTLGKSLLDNDIPSMSVEGFMPEKLFQESDCHSLSEVSLCEQSIGTSLIKADNLTLGKSLLDEDGCSMFCEESELDGGERVESEWSPLAASTPTKTKDTPDTVENVVAFPKASSVDNFVMAETSTGGNKMLKKALTYQSIINALQSKCHCGSKCIKKYTLANVKSVRYKFWSKSRQMRSQWLIQTIKNGEKTGRFLNLYVDNGIKVCTQAFLKLYNMDKNMLVRCRKVTDKNAVAEGAKNNRPTTPSVVNCIGWFEDYLSRCGDRMPDSDKVMLPYRTTKISVYGVYKEDIIKGNDKPVSRSTFENIWKWHFPQLKIKKTNSFSICNICVALERRLEKEVAPFARAQILKDRHEHNQRQMLERKYYYSKREKSKKDPSSFLSLIIDGMDQSKSSLPHIVGQKPKIINPADLLKTHITGVIDHGHNEFSTYLDYNQYPHDPNLTLNILLKTLIKVAEKENNQLPPVLYLQADNCFRENKNKFVLAFCELLVEERIFTEVHLSFLFVGHTHEDVDACFSKIVEKLKRNDAETIPELKKLLPNVTELDHMRGWSGGAMVLG